MKADKLKKIKAIMDDPATTENEKEICRSLIAKHKVDEPPPVFSPDIQSLEDLFRGMARASFDSQLQAAAFQQAQHRAQRAQRQFETGFQGGILSGLFAAGKLQWG